MSKNMLVGFVSSLLLLPLLVVVIQVAVEAVGIGNMWLPILLMVFLFCSVLVFIYLDYKESKQS